MELRLEPWYGRPQSRFVNVSDATAAAFDTPDGNTVAVPVARRHDNGNSGGGGGGHNGRRGKRVPGSGGASKTADLLACGCILSEMCAGEPVLAGSCVSERAGYGSGGRGEGGKGGRGNWLEAAVDLPPALRGAIGALTHPDPSQVFWFLPDFL